MAREQTILKKVLKERGLTGYRIAKDCGIATHSVYAMLNGNIEAFPGWRRKLSEYLGVPENELFID